MFLPCADRKTPETGIGRRVPHASARRTPEVANTRLSNDYPHDKPFVPRCGHPQESGYSAKYKKNFRFPQRPMP
ncbi:hypothetical protein [uncultured Parabacteroides sp.]|uniref:hypothetical protein n=1 Tax=uncultured Parabacteroides sp. TaxID=512312 RepID=UPI0026EAD29D|nr:hypothetical protein [uncultured Parabacteroides sp.]